MTSVADPAPSNETIKYITKDTHSHTSAACSEYSSKDHHSSRVADPANSKETITYIHEDELIRPIFSITMYSLLR